jgi:hypothetical protein
VINKFEIIPYKIDHLDLFDLKYGEDKDTLKYETYIREDIGEKGVTAKLNGRPIFSCGMQLINSKVGQCWIVSSKYISGSKLGTVKVVRELLDSFAKEHKLKRVQTLVDEKFIDWIRLFGFKQESVMEKIKDDGGDRYMYVKLFN